MGGMRKGGYRTSERGRETANKWYWLHKAADGPKIQGKLPSELRKARKRKQVAEPPSKIKSSSFEWDRTSPNEDWNSD